MSKIAIDKEKLAQAYKAATDEQKQLLADLYGEEIFRPRDITERIKTFDDAFRALGAKHPLVQEFVNKISYNSSPDLEAYMMLRIICAALNEGWVANYHNLEQDKWFPWFTYRDGGFVYALAGNSASYSNAYHGVRLAYRTKELAEYAGKQFVDIYKKLLL